MPNREEKLIGVLLITIMMIMTIIEMMEFNFLDVIYLVVIVVYFCKFLVIKGRSWQIILWKGIIFLWR